MLTKKLGFEKLKIQFLNDHEHANSNYMNIHYCEIHGDLHIVIALDSSPIEGPGIIYQSNYLKLVNCIQSQCDNTHIIISIENLDV